MSDLAPFVAAALRDKVVSDLKEENDQLREELRKCRAVEITGQGGDPVYARAQFGDNGKYAGNPNLWCVSFQQLRRCPLSELPNVEVRVGGIVKGTFGDNNVFEGFLDLKKEDYENGKVVSFFIAGASQLWLSVMVHGWPEVRWRSVIAEDVDPDDLLQYLSETVDAQPPTKTAVFKSVSFTNETVSGAIENLSLDQAVEEERQRREKEMVLLGPVAGRMRSAGKEEEPSTFVSQVWQVVYALQDMGIYEPGGRFEATIDTLVQLHAVALDNELPFVDVYSRFIANNHSFGEDNGGSNENEAE